MSKDLWLRKLLKLAERDIVEAMERLTINEYGESRVYMKMVQQRISAMADYMKAKN
tara:strand:- start:22505 stop:22672 length:168 start_codon:yes stop_codon:yes gene_type:complete